MNRNETEHVRLEFLIRNSVAADAPAIIALLPRLADFDIPATREPEHLWHGDRDMVRAWAKGERDDVDVAVAITDSIGTGGMDLTLADGLISSKRGANGIRYLQTSAPIPQVKDCSIAMEILLA